MDVGWIRIENKGEEERVKKSMWHLFSASRKTSSDDQME